VNGELRSNVILRGFHHAKNSIRPLNLRSAPFAQTDENRRGDAMADADAAVSELDSEHCRAICEEIGARLRHALPPTTSDLPVRIAELLARLVEQDHGAPPIAPSLEEVEIESGRLVEGA
jgi:hypothetical protein